MSEPLKPEPDVRATCPLHKTNYDPYVCMVCNSIVNGSEKKEVAPESVTNTTDGSMLVHVRANDPIARELLVRAIKWIERLCERRASIPHFFDNDTDPAPLAKDIRGHLARSVHDANENQPTPPVSQNKEWEQTPEIKELRRSLFSLRLEVDGESIIDHHEKLVNAALASLRSSLATAEAVEPISHWENGVPFVHDQGDLFHKATWEELCASLKKAEYYAAKAEADTAEALARLATAEKDKKELEKRLEEKE